MTQKACVYAVTAEGLGAYCKLGCHQAASLADAQAQLRDRYETVFFPLQLRVIPVATPKRVAEQQLFSTGLLPHYRRCRNGRRGRQPEVFCVRSNAGDHAAPAAALMPQVHEALDALEVSWDEAFEHPLTQRKLEQLRFMEGLRGDVDRAQAWREHCRKRKREEREQRHAEEKLREEEKEKLREEEKAGHAARVCAEREQRQEKGQRAVEEQEALKAWVMKHVISGEDSNFISKSALEGALRSASIPFQPMQLKRCILELFTGSGVYSKTNHRSGGARYPTAWMGLKWNE